MSNISIFLSLYNGRILKLSMRWPPLSRCPRFGARVRRNADLKLVRGQSLVIGAARRGASCRNIALCFLFRLLCARRLLFALKYCPPPVISAFVFRLLFSIFCFSYSIFGFSLTRCCQFYCYCYYFWKTVIVALVIFQFNNMCNFIRICVSVCAYVFVWIDTR